MLKGLSLMLAYTFLLLTSYQAVVIMHFKLNQIAIEKEFCVNIDKPELQCKGKCYLQEKLKKSESSDSEQTVHYKNFELALTVPTELIFESSTSFQLKERLLYRRNSKLNPDVEIFHPPPNIICMQWVRLS